MNEQSYDDSTIIALEGLQPVRKRPGMYIGSTGSQGLHHCLWEVVDNSVDEAMAGYCDAISVTIHEDDSVSVEDNGRGIPVDPQQSGSYKGMPTIEMVMTVLHAGGKFGGGAYTYSGGLHGVGISVVNALAEWLDVTIDRGGERHHIGFSVSEEIVDGTARTIPGKVSDSLRYVKKIPLKETGTLIHFKPDSVVFTTTEWQIDAITRRLRHTSFLNPGLTCTLIDERTGNKFEYHYPGGLVDFMKSLSDERLEEYSSREKESSHEAHVVIDEPIFLHGSKNSVGEWQICLQWFPDTWYRVESYANGIETVDGGTHVDGFQAALTRIINSYARQDHVSLLTKRDPNLEASDIRSGLGIIVAVKVPEPQFQGQTKAKLGNDSVKEMVRSGFYDCMWSWMEEHPAEISLVIQKAVSEMRLRRKLADAAEKERQSQQKGYAPKSQSLPVKLNDCDTKDRSEAEIFIVEGDSAAGPAIMARNWKTQAVFPIRGKILNVNVADTGRISANKEVQGIIAGLGAGSEDLFKIDHCRYRRVIILTDADDDGKHIQLLLMTMFYRLMKPLVEDGRLYVARTPLFSTTIKDQKVYVYDVNEKEKYDQKYSNLNWTRFKGLGEMNASELGQTAINPDTRKLSQLYVEDFLDVDNTINELMGNDTSTKWDALSDLQVDASEAISL